MGLVSLDLLKRIAYSYQNYCKHFNAMGNTNKSLADLLTMIMIAKNHQVICKQLDKHELESADGYYYNSNISS